MLDYFIPARLVMTEPIELLPTKKSKEKKNRCVVRHQIELEAQCRKKEPKSSEAVKFMCRNSGSVALHIITDYRSRAVNSRSRLLAALE